MLMFGSSKHNRENYPRKYFWTQEKETRIKFNPGLSANRPSNNWALVLVGFNLSLDGPNLHFHWCRFYWMPETGWRLCIHSVMVLETNSLLNLSSSFFCSVSPFQVMWSLGYITEMQWLRRPDKCDFELQPLTSLHSHKEQNFAVDSLKEVYCCQTFFD